MSRPASSGYVTRQGKVPGTVILTRLIQYKVISTSEDGPMPIRAISTDQTVILAVDGLYAEHDRDNWVSINALFLGHELQCSTKFGNLQNITIGQANTHITISCTTFIWRNIAQKPPVHNRIRIQVLISHDFSYPM